MQKTVTTATPAQIEQARKATVEILGYDSWEDANDYRLTGAQNRERDRVYNIVLAATLAPPTGTIKTEPPSQQLYIFSAILERTEASGHRISTTTKQVLGHCWSTSQAAALGEFLIKTQQQYPDFRIEDPVYTHVPNAVLST